MPRLLLGVAWLLACAQVIGACPGSPDPATRELIARDPAKALEQARTEIAALEPSPTRDPGRLASLYLKEAESYSGLELDAEARAAALKGLELLPNPLDPLHLGLQMTYAVNVYDQSGIEKAIQGLEAARARQSAGSVTEICLRTTIGRLQFRQNHIEPAILNLTQAYRASMAQGLEEERVLAAEPLSSVMRVTGDYAQALALNEEAIEWNTQHGATLNLSVSEDMRGAILLTMEDYAAAIEVYTHARRLSEQLNDQQGIAFADLHLCEARIELQQLAQARPDCESALSAFTTSQSLDMVKQTRAALARIDIEQGHAERALTTLNEVLDQHGEDMPARQVAALYKLRARANAATRKYRSAYTDLDEYVRRYVAVNDAERSRQVAALRARFETDREIERNAFLERELDLAQDRSARQKELLRWTVGAIVAGGLITALLTYILIANLRHRRELLRLASQDALTGLPNRRRTAELAKLALRTAIDSGKPLTVGIIDLDRFKSINDRCGHATGDFVLKEFARMSRVALRASDILGRWGGEEFLLVVPEATFDAAFGIVERLRAQTGQITLPASAQGLRVSLSVGLATHRPGINSLEELIAAADSALYNAKAQGRDLICVADSTAVVRALRSQLGPESTGTHV